jgi:hypothetical protein
MSLLEGHLVNIGQSEKLLQAARAKIAQVLTAGQEIYQVGVFYALFSGFCKLKAGSNWSFGSVSCSGILKGSYHFSLLREFMYAQDLYSLKLHKSQLCYCDLGSAASIVMLAWYCGTFEPF